MMHYETFDLFGAIKHVNALRPPGQMPEHGLFEPSPQGQLEREEEGVGAMVLADEPPLVWEILQKGVLVRKQSSGATGNVSGGCCTHWANRSRQSSGVIRVPHQGAPNLAFYCCPSHTVLLDRNSDLKEKKKMKRKITIYNYIYFIQIL